MSTLTSSSPFVPSFSLDRPFGIHLWPIFDRLFTAVAGYPAASFRFSDTSTAAGGGDDDDGGGSGAPLSTTQSCAALLVSYYVIVLGGREFMRHRAAFQLRWAFIAHNLVLSLLSASLLALFLEQLIPTLARHGVIYAICDGKGGWTQPLVVLYYLNYLTKYVELLDTVFLVLKKKPLTFLHTYHHGATALLCFIQLHGHTAVSWVPITLNLSVHVIMYWYYFQSARGIRGIWYKRYLTLFQIIQFLVDLGFVYLATYTHYAYRYWPWLPNCGDCHGEEFAAVSGGAILSSYLVLFISFYFATYKMGIGRASSGAVGNAARTGPAAKASARAAAAGAAATAN